MDWLAVGTAHDVEFVLEMLLVMALRGEKYLKFILRAQRRVLLLGR